MNPKEEKIRQEAVRRYLAGESPKSIYTSLQRCKVWFFKWVARHRTGDPHWFRDLSRAPKNVPNRTDPKTEELVCSVRKQLEENNEFYGAQAILWTLEDLGLPQVPSLMTINRILKRNGLIRPREKRYKPKGKAYPSIEVKGLNDLHQMDIVGPRYLVGPIRFYSANVMDIYSHRVAINPMEAKNSQCVLRALVAAWKRLGIPKYLQLDNQLPFRGSNRYPHSFGALIKLCLHLGVQPVFIPLHEPWRNGSIEKFQDYFQVKFLRQVHMESFSELLQQSMCYENRHNNRYRYSVTKGRTPVRTVELSNGKLHLLESDFQMPNMRKKPSKGRIHLMRFIRSHRILDIFGEKFKVSDKLIYEYVRATIFVKEQKLKVFLDENQMAEFEYRLT